MDSRKPKIWSKNYTLVLVANALFIIIFYLIMKLFKFLLVGFLFGNKPSKAILGPVIYFNSQLPPRDVVSTADFEVVHEIKITQTNTKNEITLFMINDLKLKLYYVKIRKINKKKTF